MPSSARKPPVFRSFVGHSLRLGLALATACSSPDQPAPAATASRDDNLTLGNPSGAVASPGSPANYLLVRDQYALSYNRNRANPTG